LPESESEEGEGVITLDASPATAFETGRVSWVIELEKGCEANRVPTEELTAPDVETSRGVCAFNELENGVVTDNETVNTAVF